MQLTVAEIRQAYSKIGFEPAQKEWIDLESKTCCPLTAVVIARGKATPKSFAALELELEGALNERLGEWLDMSVPFVVGFTNGFDYAEGVGGISVAPPAPPVGPLGSRTARNEGCALGGKVRQDLGLPTQKRSLW